MKFVKIVGVLLLIYVGIVVTFESLLGYFQPQNQGTLTITTQDAEGEAHERVVARIESDGKLYVAANHWPRAWYRRALENPKVKVRMDGETGVYRAVPVSDDTYERVDSEHDLGWKFRFLTGYPPRRILHLQPVQDAAA